MFCGIGSGVLLSHPTTSSCSSRRPTCILVELYLHSMYCYLVVSFKKNTGQRCQKQGLLLTPHSLKIYDTFSIQFFVSIWRFRFLPRGCGSRAKKETSMRPLLKTGGKKESLFLGILKIQVFLSVTKSGSEVSHYWWVHE